MSCTIKFVGELPSPMSAKGVFETDSVTVLVTNTEKTASPPFGFNKALIDADDDVIFVIVRLTILGGNGNV